MRPTSSPTSPTTKSSSFCKMPASTQIEGLAFPFTFGLAIGLALGRTLLQSTLAGVGIGLVLVGLFAVVRSRLVS